MRRTAALAPLAVAGALALGGCGSSSADYQNDPRPPAPIVITGYIDDQRVSDSPRALGAGPISLIVTNQTGAAQRVTLESAGPAGSGPGIRQVTAPISPQDTATLKVDVKPGSYSVHVAEELLGALRGRLLRERTGAEDGPEAEQRGERPYRHGHDGVRCAGRRSTAATGRSERSRARARPSAVRHGWRRRRRGPSSCRA